MINQIDMNADHVIRGAISKINWIVPYLTLTKYYSIIKNQYVPIVLSFLLFTSCSVFRETHYFKDRIEDNQVYSINNSVSNYYKVKIKGWAFLSSSRYVSGYFDTAAVNEYFNEIAQPEGGRIFLVEDPKEECCNADKKQPPKGDTDTTPKKSTRVTETNQADNKDTEAQIGSGKELETHTGDASFEKPKTKENEPQSSGAGDNSSNSPSSGEDRFKETGDELVLILSTNADAVAKEIKNTSVNNDILKSLTLLAHKDELDQANLLETEKSGINNDIDLFILEVDAQLGNIKESSTLQHNQTVLFQFIKSELKEMGVNKEFDNFSELKTWYHENF